MITHFVLAFLAIVVSYAYSRLYYRRFRQFATIPQLPPSLLWGHLQAFDTFTRSGPKDRHPGISSTSFDIVSPQYPMCFSF